MESPSDLPPAPPPWYADGADEESIAPTGYRILRRLGEGSRAVVYLGRAIMPGPADAALKVFSPVATPASIDSELSVLDATNALGSPHIVRLMDVADDGQGSPCLVLAPCTAGDLRGLLHLRGSIEPGEAVTVLAPVIEALGAAHAAGWCHGALRTSSILFDATGAPVLCGWGHGARLAGARSGPKGAEQREANARAIAADIGRFLALACGVLDCVSVATAPAAVDALRARLDELARTRDAARPHDIADLLYDFAEPLPVRLAGGEPTEERGSPEPEGPVALGAVRPVVVEAPLSTMELPQHTASPTAGRGPQHDTPTRSSALARRVADCLRRLRSALGTVRPRVWLVAAIPFAALLAVLLLEGGDQPDAVGRARNDQIVAPAVGTSPPQTPPPPTDAPPTQDSAILADDPVPAAGALLSAREECFRTLSVLCLDAVAAEGSVALEADRNAVRALQEGRGASVPSLAGRTPVLVERLGDSALLELPPSEGRETTSASLLLQRGEAGWRIRGVLVD